MPCLAALLLLAASATAAPAPIPTRATAPAPALVALEVRGDLPDARSFSLAQLQALGAVDANWTAHGATHRVRGVPLDALLTAAGFTPGPMGKEVPKREKRSGWKKIVIADAADGYQAVFSAAELFPEMGPTRALLVWEVDGAPLSQEQGPLRLVVLTDGEPSRSIYSLRTLEVIDARDLHAEAKHP